MVEPTTPAGAEWSGGIYNMVRLRRRVGFEQPPFHKSIIQPPPHTLKYGLRMQEEEFFKDLFIFQRKI